MHVQIEGAAGTAAIKTSAVTGLTLSNSLVQTTTQQVVTGNRSVTLGTYPNAQNTLSSVLSSICNPAGSSPVTNGTNATQSPQTAAAVTPKKIIYRGKATANGVFNVGTQTQKTLGGTFNFSIEQHRNTNYEWLNNPITSFVIDGDYGSAAKRYADYILTNQRYSGIATQGFKNGNSTIYGFAYLRHHMVLGMRFQQEYGIGYKQNFESEKRKNKRAFGSQLINNLSLSADIRSIHQKLYEPGNRFSSLGAGFQVGNFVNVGPKDRPITLSEQIEIIPAFKSAKALQVRSLFSVSIPITKRFSILSSFGDEYLRNAPEGRRQNYSKTSIGLTLDLSGTSKN